MAPAVDGRIVTRDWPLPAGLTAEYEGTAAALRGDAWIIGRVSMEPCAGKARFMAPVADGAVGTATLFDAGPRGATRRLQLRSAERRRGGFLWVRYRVQHGEK